MKDANELRQALTGYTGGEHVYRHNMVRTFNYTEGAKAFFQNAGQGAYWLADILATEPAIKAGVRSYGFCLAVLDVKDKAAVITVARDATELHYGGRETKELMGYQFDSVAYTRKIDFTDCPEGLWKFYLTWTEVGGGPVILCMLPSEY
jgi:hypothetical protein